MTPSTIRAGVVDLARFRHLRIKKAAEAVRARHASSEPLLVLDAHIRRLAQSARNARRAGVPELADTRRVQILALNDVRRDILGRKSA